MNYAALILCLLLTGCELSRVARGRPTTPRQTETAQRQLDAGTTAASAAAATMPIPWNLIGVGIATYLTGILQEKIVKRRKEATKE